MTSTKPWHGIMTVSHISHWDGDRLLWTNRNVKNTLHFEGERFLLEAAFVGGRLSTTIPDLYYLGLDSRGTVAASDTIDNVFSEPVGNGYSRQPLASSGDFSISQSGSHYVAKSPLLAFSASPGGVGWGPVQNLFLTTESNNEGILISTASIGTVLSVAPGQTITFQLTMSLFDVPNLG